MEKKKSKKGLIIALVIVAVIILGVIFMIWLGSSDETAEEETQTEEVSAENDEEEAEEAEEAEESDTEESFTKSATGSGSTWTIMIYMCGSDLESKFGAATGNLEEILRSGYGDNINVMVETGGSKEWQMSSPGVDAKTLGFYRLSGGEMTLEKTEPSKSMGDPENLKDFILWAKDAAPADKYMLIFWDHGGGTSTGVCFDELYDADAITLAEMKEAISEADVPFEIIGYDACLMSTLETAEAIQGYGHYMLASEETEPGGGWDYEDFLAFLDKDTSMDGLKLGSRIADKFLAKCALTDEDDMATLSVTDLTKLPTLSAAYRRLSGEMILCTQDSKNLRIITQGATKAENFGPNTDADGYTNMVDLGDLVKNTGSVLTQNAETVTKSLNDAVRYNVHGSSRRNSNGLAVFYPLGVTEDDLNTYNNTVDNTAFSGFMDVVLGRWDSAEWEKNWEEAWKEAYGTGQEVKEGKYDSLFNSGQSIAPDYNEELPEDYFESVENVKPVEKDEYNLKYTIGTDSDGYNQLKITSSLDMVSYVDFLLYYEDPDSGSYIYLGSDNNLDCDYEKGIFTEAFAGEWMTIGDEFVYADIIEENDDYNLYLIPIRLNGEEKFLKAVYDFKEEGYRILGAFDGLDEDSGAAGRDVKKLQKGDKIEFLFYIYDPEKEDDDGELVSMSEIVWDDSMKMEDAMMADGRVIYQFLIGSVFGDEDTSDPIYMKIEDGEIYVEE